VPRKWIKVKIWWSRVYRVIKYRPLAEVLVEVMTGVMRRITMNLPFTVRSSGSVYRVDPHSKKKYIIDAVSCYNYIEETSKKTRVVSHSERFAVVTHKVNVDLHHGIVYSKGKTLILESTVWSEAFLNHLKVPTPCRAVKASSLNRVQVVLASNSFYHFLIEDLPDLLKILAVEPEVEVITWSNAPSYVTEALDILGVKFLQSQRFVYFDKLIFAEKTKNGAPSEFAGLQLQKNFRSKGVAVKESEKLQIYISRVRDSRSPWYESQLIELLEQSGKWIVLDLSLLSFVEQIRYAQSAKVWAGVHGAGLSWISMLAPSSVAIEIGHVISDCFEQLAHLNQVSFARISFEKPEFESAKFVFDEIDRILINLSDL
jgi:hypothetical protein